MPQITAELVLASPIPLETQVKEISIEDSTQQMQNHLPRQIYIRRASYRPAITGFNISEPAAKDVWRPLAVVLSNKSAYKTLLLLKDEKAQSMLYTSISYTQRQLLGIGSPRYSRKIGACRSVYTNASMRVLYVPPTSDASR